MLHNRPQEEEVGVHQLAITKHPLLRLLRHARGQDAVPRRPAPLLDGMAVPHGVQHVGAPDKGLQQRDAADRHVGGL